MPKKKLPPHNLAAEQAVLASVLYDNNALFKAIELGLQKTDFYQHVHQFIFEAYLDLSSKMEPIDLLTTKKALEEAKKLDAVGGPAYLSELSDAIGVTANLEYYINMIQEASILRRAIFASQEVIEESYKDDANPIEILDLADSKLLSIREGRPAITVISPRWNPLVRASRSMRPVLIPVT